MQNVASPIEQTASRAPTYPRWAAILLGSVAMLTAAFGLLSVVWGFIAVSAGVLEPITGQHRLVNHNAVFYAMASISAAAHLTLLVLGARFLTKGPPPARAFVALMVLEVAYFFAPTLLAPLAPSIGGSIRAADGIANGGVMAQFITLLPLWGPFVAVWLSRRYRAGSVADTEAQRACT